VLLSHVALVAILRAGRTPADVANEQRSHTARFLKEALA